MISTRPFGTITWITAPSLRSFAPSTATKALTHANTTDINDMSEDKHHREDPGIMVATEEGVGEMIHLGQVEVNWSTCVHQMWTNLHYLGDDMDPEVWGPLADDLIRSWPRTLLQRIPWGPQPHFGTLGGLSVFQFEAALDRLDFVIAETVLRSGRTRWTDLAWRTIARLGRVQRRCPDCGQVGPQHQELWACDLCTGVNWGSGALY